MKQQLYIDTSYSSLLQHQIHDVLKSSDSITISKCPRCNSIHIIKNGFTKLGRQRYFCRDCERSFSETTGTALMYSKKSHETWIRYLDCISCNMTLRQSAAHLNISITTSFFWRHKILSVLNSSHKPNKLSNTIEIHELKLMENFKGSRSLPPDITADGRNYVILLSCMDTDENRLLRVSVMTKIPRLDRLALDQFLAPAIENGKIIVVPRNDKYINFAKYHKMKICMVGSSRYGIQGMDAKRANIQSVIFKKFVRRFAGVATKYLSYYIQWFFLNVNRTGDLLKDLFSMLKSGKRQLRVYEFNKVQFDGSLAAY